MRIGEAVSGEKYRTDKQFKILPISKISIVFQI